MGMKLFVCSVSSDASGYGASTLYTRIGLNSAKFLLAASS